jgi:hypothetical protein
MVEVRNFKEYLVINLSLVVVRGENCKKWKNWGLDWDGTKKFN